MHAPAICLAPQYLAEELLRLEGFSQVTYVERAAGANLIDSIEAKQADMSMDAAPAIVYGMDTRKSVVTLAGIHAGCYELLGNERIHAIRDLKGKSVAVYALGGPDHVLLSSMLAYVGLDPTKEVRWVVEDRLGDAMQLFIEGKVDAFMGFAPQPQELRARKIGHVIIDTAQDRPWSQYFCCMVFANKDFVERYPVATKRALRAYLKAADVCTQEPERVARFLGAKGYEPRYDIALEVLKKLPYHRWRDADPEDTMRFFALRLQEVGMIKTTPHRLVAQGTNWRFLNELRKELKA
jgi:NitT/TauT family transport system substrate-binding protein